MMCRSFIYSCFLVNSTVFLHVNFHFVSFTAGAVRPFCRGINCSACPVGVFFCEEKDAKEFLGQDCSRLTAGWGLLQRKNLHAYPAGAYFCMRKSRQNALGAVPQDPLTLKLRLDTNDAKASSVQRRRYALKVPAAHFYVGFSRNQIKINTL